MESVKKVAFNTGFLYGKMLITIFISLYSTRLILGALGVEDFGIFNLVAGVIGMLSFLRSAMTVSTQRYLSYNIGARDKSKLKAVFSTSKVLHLIVGLCVVLILELAGIFLFNGRLNIPEDRVEVAKIIYHFMVLSTFFMINAVPYDASINAHENMLFDAITGILEAVCKLGIAIWIVNTDKDKLIVYGVLIASLTILIRVIKSVYCLKRYSECRASYKLAFKAKMFKEMFSFASWNLFGAFSNVVKNQGLAIILNLFVGVVSNAAFGVANQVSGQLSAFSTNIIKALNPQIVKSEGSGDRPRMLRLAIFGCKLSFFLFSFFAIPLVLEMHYILKIWLKVIPVNAEIFCQLIIIMSFFPQLTWGLMVAVQSVGKIKVYQSVVSTIIILNLPLAILLLRLGLPPYSVFIGAIFLEMLAGGARVFFAKRLTGLDAKLFLKNSFLSMLSIAIAASIGYSIQFILDESFLRLVISTASIVLTIFITGRFIAFSNEENSKIAGLIKPYLNKLLGKINLQV